VSAVSDQDDAVEIRLLGPFEVVRNGSTVQLGTRKQRAVLALLALEPNSAIPTDRLIDALWGEDPPASARAVQTYVAGLRKGLDGTGIEVSTRGPGYSLEVEAAAVDAERFRVLVRDARKHASLGAREVAADMLRDALALWRGRPLEEFHPEPGLVDAAERLEAQRIGATEERIEADLSAGASAALVDELEALVTEHPYRERLRGQLMRALYLVGRQGDALESYRDARRARRRPGSSRRRWR
jgi:DNA-binding SARP family transcriptional activator